MYTYEYVAQVLKEIVYDKGEDYVYERIGGICYYYDPHTKEPSCLVGHFFAREEILFDDEEMDLENSGVAYVLDELDAHHDIAFDEESQLLLWHAQAEQDSGRPWGMALDYAMSKVAESRK